MHTRVEYILMLKDMKSLADSVVNAASNSVVIHKGDSYLYDNDSGQFPLWIKLLRTVTQHKCPLFYTGYLRSSIQIRTCIIIYNVASALAAVDGDA